MASEFAAGGRFMAGGRCWTAPMAAGGCWRWRRGGDYVWLLRAGIILGWPLFVVGVTLAAGIGGGRLLAVAERWRMVSLLAAGGCWYWRGGDNCRSCRRRAAARVGGRLALTVGIGGWEALAASAGDRRLLALAASWPLSYPFAVGSGCGWRRAVARVGVWLSPAASFAVERLLVFARGRCLVGGSALAAGFGSA